MPIIKHTFLYFIKIGLMIFIHSLLSCTKCNERSIYIEDTELYENMINDVENRVFTYSHGVSFDNKNIIYKRFTIAHCSDIHAGCTNWDKNTKEFLDFCSRPKIRNRLEALLCTGDLSNGEAGRAQQVTIEEIRSVTKLFLQQNISSYFVIGNHDSNINEAGYNNINVFQDAIDKDLQYQLIIKPFLDSSVSSTVNKCYYYKDFEPFGIRLICLDFIDYPIIRGRNNSLKYEMGYYFSQAQLDWLNQVLMSTPNNYGVIVALHGVPTNNLKIGTYDQGTEMLSEIINAYKNGGIFIHEWKSEKYPELSTSVKFDFSRHGNKEFICWLVGHIHNRVIVSIDKYDDQLIISAPCIYTNKPLADSTNVFARQMMLLNRSDNSISQNSFNIISIDRNMRKIYLTAFGAYLDNYGLFTDRTKILDY